MDFSSDYKSLHDLGAGLKILGPVKRSCQFKSGPGHQTPIKSIGYGRSYGQAFLCPKSGKGVKK